MGGGRGMEKKGLGREGELGEIIEGEGVRERGRWVGKGGEGEGGEGGRRRRGRGWRKGGSLGWEGREGWWGGGSWRVGEWVVGGVVWKDEAEGELWEKFPLKE